MRETCLAQQVVFMSNFSLLHAVVDIDMNPESWMNECNKIMRMKIQPTVIFCGASFNEETADTNFLKLSRSYGGVMEEFYRMAGCWSTIGWLGMERECEWARVPASEWVKLNLPLTQHSLLSLSSLSEDCLGQWKEEIFSLCPFIIAEWESEDQFHLQP